MIVESDLASSLVASVDPSSDAAFTSLPGSVIDVQVIDDDVAGILMEQTNGSTIVSELGLDDDFSLSLAARPASDVVLVIDGAAIEQAVFTPSTLTFTPDNWDQIQQVVVSTPLDFDADRNSIGSVFVNVDPATTAHGFADLGPRTLSVVHVDAVINDLRVRRRR